MEDATEERLLERIEALEDILTNIEQPPLNQTITQTLESLNTKLNLAIAEFVKEWTEFYTKCEYAVL